ncbi:MAG: GNAT family N-acetyltransferase [Magnetovibrio sp.]|nr:GNAT family N-acetyltransferase [Magnetovibrio sp.]
MKSFLIGKNIYIRGLKQDEIAEDSPYFEWLNDLSLDLYTERTYFPNTPERMEAYFKDAQKFSKTFLMGIFDNASDKHIGNISFTNINYFNRNAFIGYLLGDKDFTGKGIITQAVLMTMYYGFNKLNFERIYGGVSTAHAASYRVCEKVGLLKEGLQRNHLYRNGQWFDQIPVGALREEWMRDFGDQARETFDELPT